MCNMCNIRFYLQKMGLTFQLQAFRSLFMSFIRLSRHVQIFVCLRRKSGSYSTHSPFSHTKCKMISRAAGLSVFCKPLVSGVFHVSFAVF